MQIRSILHRTADNAGRWLEMDAPRSKRAALTTDTMAISMPEKLLN